MVNINDNEEYWSMSLQDKGRVYLLCQFNKFMYEMMKELIRNKPIYQLPYMRAIMYDLDITYKLVNVH
jgi:hypothetical protein